MKRPGLKRLRGLNLISDAYRAQLEQLHREHADFGTSSPMYADIIRGVIKRYQPEQLLDIGCGKASLKDALGIRDGYIGYDPAIPEYSAIPSPSDLTVCVDVLEHIEMEHLDSVLDFLRDMTKKVGFFAVHTGPAMHHLPDGRNAHITQRPAEWWLKLILDRFKLRSFDKDVSGFWCIVEPIGIE